MTRKNDIHFDYNSEFKKCKTIDDVLGKNGLVQKLIKDVLENILEAEMEEHLGRDKYKRQSDIQAEIEDLYGITISPSMVSKITDKVIATATEW